MEIANYAVIFFGLTTAISLGLYWHTTAKLAELVLSTRLDELQQDLQHQMHNLSKRMDKLEN